jgi:hypothetical protein
MNRDESFQGAGSRREWEVYGVREDFLHEFVKVEAPNACPFPLKSFSRT